MHIGPSPPSEPIPALRADCAPPAIHGAAALAHQIYGQPDLPGLLGQIHRLARTGAEQAALAFDTSLAFALHFQPEQAAALQAQALAACPLFRVTGGIAARSARPLRLLAFVAPGSLMVNTPLDFITTHLDVQLDLLFVRPGQPLPLCLPEHDVAFCAIGEGEPGLLRRLAPLLRGWPRPVVNDPTAIARLSRDALALAFAGAADPFSPPALRLPRAAFAAHLDGSAPIALLAADQPALVRPAGTHAGDGLAKVGCRADLARYLAATDAAELFVTRFVDCRGADGMFRKARVALIGRAPYLCHWAVSSHWMVHYLNAGMAEHADRRAEEARAMETFDTGFAVRHAAAFAALCDWGGLDYFQIDCAETPDGRLLVFEAAVAGIVHLLDPPHLFPYKPAPMRRLFRAFEALLRRRGAGSPR